MRPPHNRVIRYARSLIVTATVGLACGLYWIAIRSTQGNDAPARAFLPARARAAARPVAVPHLFDTICLRRDRGGPLLPCEIRIRYDGVVTHSRVDLGAPNSVVTSVGEISEGDYRRLEGLLTRHDFLGMPSRGKPRTLAGRYMCYMSMPTPTTISATKAGRRKSVYHGVGLESPPAVFFQIERAIEETASMVKDWKGIR